jgi:hypothetical protein
MNDRVARLSEGQRFLQDGKISYVFQNNRPLVKIFAPYERQLYASNTLRLRLASIEYVSGN